MVVYILRPRVHAEQAISLGLALAAVGAIRFVHDVLVKDIVRCARASDDHFSTTRSIFCNETAGMLKIKRMTHRTGVRRSWIHMVIASAGSNSDAAEPRTSFMSARDILLTLTHNSMFGVSSIYKIPEMGIRCRRIWSLGTAFGLVFRSLGTISLLLLSFSIPVNRPIHIPINRPSQPHIRKT